MFNFEVYFELYPEAFIAAVGVFSLLMGSFFNVVIYRLPLMADNKLRLEYHALMAQPLNDEGVFNLSLPKSHCPNCQQEIKFYQNIPLISWLVLKGKCYNCKIAISKRYPLLEIFTALVSAVIAWHFGFSLQCGFALCLFWCLLNLSMIGVDKKPLPLPLINLGLYLALLAAVLNVFHSSEQAILGASLVYFTLFVFGQIREALAISKKIKQNNIIFFTMLGAWLGWQNGLYLLLIIVFSSLIYQLLLKKNKGLSVLKPYSVIFVSGIAFGVLVFA